MNLENYLKANIAPLKPKEKGEIAGDITTQNNISAKVSTIVQMFPRTEEYKSQQTKSILGSDMDSAQLSRYINALSHWYPFRKQSIAEAPSQIGIYIIRKEEGKRFGRLQGESDILYIGSAKSKGGLKQRLTQYFHPGPTQSTNQRIYDFAKKYHMEIAWYPCDQPKDSEYDLLWQYLNEHDELPPFNYATIRKLYKFAQDHGVGIDFGNREEIKGNRNDAGAVM